MPLTLHSRAPALAAPDSPFAGLIGASRRAAFRRRLIRRIAAVGLLLIAATLILMRPGASGNAQPDPGSGSGASDHTSGGTVVPTGPPSAEAITDAATPSGLSSASHDPGDEVGALAVPPGRIGVVVPVETAVAARLKTGDRVDIYRAGNSKRVATEALVVDVTRPTALQASDFGPASGGDPSAATATVFVAVLAREAPRIPAGQRGSERSATAWWLTVLPRPLTANP